MKLLFTIWISAVLTQEVFSSALVRYPRHAVSKPTSSVHTEYEATYEQKGKHGNGSYSTVSGKQEVVHDNCHDNWNAFADKCATLIKDLVASLGNAVSSKPGDATNLQLRIRNTFKHFDSTDNCTCFTKNSLTSLFDNVTASTMQPVIIHEEIIPSAQNINGNSNQVQSRTCEGESCNEESGSGQKVLSASQQRRGQPSLTLTNAEDVDPENADASKESSITNSRRGVQYPGIIVKDPSQRSRGSGAAISERKQSSSTSGSSSNTNKILSPVAVPSQPAPAPAKAIGSPAEIVTPTSQSQGSIKTRPLKPVTSSRTLVPPQTSFQNASPVNRLAKNNGIVRSAVPVPASSSASKISSPETAPIRFPSALNDAGSGSGQATGVLSDTITPLEVPVKPVEEVVPVNGEETPTESNAASNQTPVIVPLVLTEPVNSAAAKPQSDSSVSSTASGASGQIPSVVSKSKPLSGTLAEPETISIKSEGNKDEDCDEEEGSGGSKSDQTPVATPLASASGAEPQISSSNGEGSLIESNAESIQTAAPIDSITKPVNGAAVEPEIVSNIGSPEVNNGGSGQNEAEPETISIKSEGAKDEDCDEEKGSEGSEGSESVLTPVVPVAEPVSGTAGYPTSDTAAEPVSAQTETETISIKDKGDKDEDCDEEEGSKSVLTPVVPIAEPISGTAGDPTSDTAAEPVSAPVAQTETISIKDKGDKDEDCDEEKGSEGSEGSESVLTPVVPVAEPVSGTAGDPTSDTAAEPMNAPVAQTETISIKDKGDKDEDCDEEEGSKSVLTPVVPIAEPISGTAGDPTSDTAAEPVSAQTETETISIKDKGDKDEDCDEEKGSEGSESVLTPVVPIAEPISGTAGDPTSDTAAEPVSAPVAQTETISIKDKGDKDEDCDEEKGSEGSEGSESVLTPVVPVAEPVSGTAGDPTSDTAAEPVSAPVAQTETISIKDKGEKDEDCDEEEGSEGSKSVLTPVVPVAEPISGTAGDPTSDTAAEPVSAPVAQTETISIKDKGEKDEDCDEEEGSEGSKSVLTPVVPVAEPISGAAGDPTSDTAAEPVSAKTETETISIKDKGDKDEDCDEEKGSELEQIPVVPPVISAAEPQVISTNAKGDNDDEDAAGNGSNQRPVIKPVTSKFQDPSTVVPGQSTNFASNPKPSVVPAMPVSDSGDSEMPVITQAADSTNQEPLSISDDPAPPEIASASNTVNVNPGLIVKQPQSQHSARKNPSADIPLINSNSNLPDSTGPVDSAGTVNPSPIYRSLPTAPSATPSSDSAVISNEPRQPTIEQEVSKPLANDKTTQSGAGQSISSMKGIPMAPAAASQRSQGKGGKEAGEKVFIVTPVPVYPEKVIVKPAEPIEESSKKGNPAKGSALTGVEYTKPSKGGGALGPAVDTLQAGNGRQEILFTTPIPVVPAVTKEHKGDAAMHSASGKPSLQQHPLFTNLGNKKSAGNQAKKITSEPVALRPQSAPPKVVNVPAVQTAEDEDLTKPTTFQTTSTDPTPPQQSIQSPPQKNSLSLTRPTSFPRNYFETPHGAPVTSPQTPHDDDDDDEEDCCSCESCTEEEVTNPKQYKEMACKDLEEARKELKAIFDKIKKRLKCGKKAPQKIVAS